MAPVIKTVMLKLTWGAFGFFLIAGPFFFLSIDMFENWRNFMVESYAAVKTYINHDVLLANEVHHDSEGKRFLETITRVSSDLEYRKD